MKLTIQVKKLNKGVDLPKIINKGEWIDLEAAETTTFCAPQSGVLKSKMTDGVREGYRNVTFDHKYVPLGVAMKLPEGLEAWLLPRSGTYGKYGIIVANSKGIIDNTYSGNNDEWKLSAIGFKHATIYQGDRICQFRIALSQKATIWQKIKWLLSSGVEIVEVDNLDSVDRNGFGSTGK